MYAPMNDNIKVGNLDGQSYTYPNRAAFLGTAYKKNSQNQNSPASAFLPEEKGIAHLINHPDYKGDPH
jgi:hypothetical protein